MTMAFRVKICGLTEPERVADAVAEGASYLGFILYPPSPRAVEPAQLRELVRDVPARVGTVGVMVDPDDGWLETVLAAAPLDVVQLHGAESPTRVAQIGERFGVRTMKAIRVETADDLAALPVYAEVADLILFDAKPPRDAAWPGGHGLPFDWTVLRGIAPSRPWALAGGLCAENLARAVELLHPPLVDVSSGVELRPGIKDPVKLRAFMAEARRLGALTPSLEETSR